MRCHQARRLFGPYWDDEITQAEREWLESHFHACATCRADYEALTRTIDGVGRLPRVEPAPDLAARVLARARRAAPEPDRLPTESPAWVPATAAAAVLVLAATIALPWLMRAPSPGGDTQVARRTEVPAPRLVEPIGQPVATTGDPVRSESAPARGTVAAAPDSLFDHDEDVEFILDPVTLHRGRVSIDRPEGGKKDERAIVSF
jgi:hypothetical protein